MGYKLTVIVDEKVAVDNKPYVHRSTAVKAYDRAYVTYGSTLFKPRSKGIVVLRDDEGRVVARADWKPGFGWY